MQEIETNDVYKGAYLLCQNSHLKEVRLKKQRVVFVFFGEEAIKEDLNYRTGQGSVNPHAYKDGIHYLRDLVSETLKKGKNHGKNTRDALSIGPFPPFLQFRFNFCPGQDPTPPELPEEPPSPPKGNLTWTGEQAGVSYGERHYRLRGLERARSIISRYKSFLNTNKKASWTLSISELVKVVRTSSNGPLRKPGLLREACAKISKNPAGAGRNDRTAFEQRAKR